MLTTAVSVDYIHEPFNPQCGIPSAREWFPYVPPDSSDLDEDLDALLDYRAPLRTAVYSGDSLPLRVTKRLVGSRGPFYLRLAKLNPTHTHAVLKDPCASLLAPLLVERFGFRGVALVRHPFAMVDSFRGLGWHSARTLERFSEDERLVRAGYPAEQKRLKHALARVEDIDVEGPAMLWRILTRVLVDTAASRDALMLVRHEDVSADPHATLRRIFRHCSLRYGRRPRRRVDRWTSGRAVMGLGGPRASPRDSRELSDERAASLRSKEQELVLRHTADLLEELYPGST